MKKPLMIACLTLLALSSQLGETFAQQTAVSPARAEVLSELIIVLEDNTEIDFGTLSATTVGDVILNPRSLADNQNVNPVNSNVAQFNVTGNASTGITFTYDPTVELQRDLSGGGDPASMTVTPTVVGAGTLAGQATAVDIPSNATNVAALTVDGTFFIWVGGVIPALSNQPTGTYEGEFTISVAYN
jgi:hypothetical protein